MRAVRYASGNLLLNLEPAIAFFLFNRSLLAARALPLGFGIACPRYLGDQAQRHPVRRQSQGAVEQEPLLRAGSHRSHARRGGVTREIKIGRIPGYQDDGFRCAPFPRGGLMGFQQFRRRDLRIIEQSVARFQTGPITLIYTRQREIRVGGPITREA